MELPLTSVIVLAFGLVLMVAVLLSERADRTVLSTSVIFLVAGFLLGGGALRLVRLTADQEMVRAFSELALFAILFVDGAGLRLDELTAAWHLPGRALLLGTPLTLGGIAVAGHLLLHMTWSEALLVGAILSPTDPVFVAAILERESVPLRLRRLLGVESGLNDGVALPIVMVLLAVVGHRQIHPLQGLAEAALGIILGVVLPGGFLWLEKRSFFAASAAYEPLGGVAIAAVMFGLSKLLGANEFLAAFASGITLATMRPDFASAFRKVGLPIAESVKLATLLVFGAVLTVPFLFATGLAGVAFALTTLVAARPLALILALLGGGLPRKEWLAAAWFGPKGFASLLYALLMLHAGVARATWLLHAIALVIVISIVAHSSTDVAVARLFREVERDNQAADENQPRHRP